MLGREYWKKKKKKKKKRKRKKIRYKRSFRGALRRCFASRRLFLLVPQVQTPSTHASKTRRSGPHFHTAPIVLLPPPLHRHLNRDRAFAFPFQHLSPFLCAILRAPDSLASTKNHSFWETPGVHSRSNKKQKKTKAISVQF